MIVLTRKKMMMLVVTYTVCSIFISIQLIKTSWMKNWSSSSLLQELAAEQEQKLLFTSLRRRRKTSMDEVHVMGIQDNTVEEDDMMRKLEAKAIRLLYRNQREGLGHALPPKTHYAFTTFQLSLGQSTSFTYNLTNYQNDTLEWNGDISSYKGRVVCEINKLHSLNMNHIPHFAQVAFPCWSVLHQFASAKRYIKLNRIQLKKLTSKWIIDLIEIFRDAGITLLDHGTSEQVGPKGMKETVWAISIDKQNNGGFPRELENLKFSVENSKYFLNSHLDVQALQRRVLATNFTQGSQRRHRMPLRALLIDRAGSTREWIYSNETASQIKREWGDDIHVKVISTLNGTLHEQAIEMHNADIIISPHGAQLTNLAFICPCTAVLELFPHNYYLGYFQPLVLSAGGIAFDGYPWDRSPLVDTSAEFISDKKTRQSLRKSPIYASPESILRVLPNVISHILSCRRGE